MILNKHNYLFFYLNTGAGHFTPAKAISDYFKKKNSIDIKLIDIFKHHNSHLEFLIVEGYKFLQHYSQNSYEILFRISKNIRLLNPFLIYISFFLKKYIKRIIEFENPQKIAIFHSFLIRPIYESVNELIDRPKLFVVVTDPFNPHPSWFLIKNLNFIVFSKQAKRICIENGIDCSFIKLLPFPLNIKIDEISTREHYKIVNRKRGLSCKQNILILGGGGGIPNGIALLRKLLTSNTSYNIIFVCGKNKKQYNCVKKLVRRYKAKNIELFGYIDFVYDLIANSEIIFTKAGASSLMEIVYLHKVPFILSYLGEQEVENVKFILENKLGILLNNLNQISSVIRDKDILDNYRENVKNFKMINGTSEVAEFIVKS